MAHTHTHPHSHGFGHSHDHALIGDRRVVLAIVLNLFLTVVEIVAGVVSGSLSLIADAVHNLSDCAALLIALAARRIGRRPSDELKTFGYRRAEVIGALVNLTALAIVGLYLIYEAVHRLFEPPVIDGALVAIVAFIALVVDLATAAMLWSMSRGNLNLRAAFLHNLGDAMNSVGVVIAGTAIYFYDAYWLDAVVTLVIAGYILLHSLRMMARSIEILMESVPSDVRLDEVTGELQAIAGVREVHHLHVWELDEEHRALEAHVVVESDSHAEWAAIKREARRRLQDQFRIFHSTLEFETPDEPDCDPCGPGTPRSC